MISISGIKKAIRLIRYKIAIQSLYNSQKRLNKARKQREDIQAGKTPWWY